MQKYPLFQSLHERKIRTNILSHCKACKYHRTASHNTKAYICMYSQNISSVHAYINITPTRRVLYVTNKHKRHYVRRKSPTLVLSLPIIFTSIPKPYCFRHLSRAWWLSLGARWPFRCLWRPSRRRRRRVRRSTHAGAARTASAHHTPATRGFEGIAMKRNKKQWDELGFKLMWWNICFTVTGAVLIDMMECVMWWNVKAYIFWSA